MNSILKKQIDKINLLKNNYLMAHKDDKGYNHKWNMLNKFIFEYNPNISYTEIDYHAADMLLQHLQIDKDTDCSMCCHIPQWSRRAK